MTKAGVIPEKWHLTKMKDCLREIKDKSYPPHPGVPYVGLEHLDSGAMDVNGCGDSSLVQSNCSSFKTGNILYGKLRPYLDKAIISPFDGICSTEIVVMDAKDNSTNQFLIYHIHSDDFVGHNVSHAFGTKMPRTSFDIIGEYLLPLPSLPEQHRIATILSTVDAAIAATDEVIAKTEELKRGLVQDLLAKGIDEDGRIRSEETHAFWEIQGMRVPVEWDVAQLRDVISEKLQSGYSGYETDENSGIRALTLTAVTENRIDISNTKYIKADPEKVKDLFIRRDDIFIERSNTVELVGLAALYEGDEPFAIYPDLLVRARANREMILPKILLESILHPKSRTYFRRSAKGTSGSMKKIDQKIIGNLYLPLPPLPEQHRIAAVLSAVDRDLAAERDHRTRLRTLKKGLMQDLLTGRKRVPLNGTGGTAGPGSQSVTACAPPPEDRP
ncbi:restriction endonuclease subunit S [Methanoculleus sp. 10]|uniref:restriction endonuclease subunit S n=1 Tax=Methanoculleus sp. 10 TaxID=430615 RepID=UPI001B439DFB|nr:restriction endonuclease subunit S [Methanoculleus sp. 10]MBP7299164.1 restriction endonuclease subunit S [Methanoculleus sp.]